MKLMINIKLLNKIINVILISIIVVFNFVNMVTFIKRNLILQENEKIELINKALIKCYALEGSFPADLFYLEKYGVNFDTQNYNYRYNVIGGNINPDVSVTLKKAERSNIFA